MSLRGIKKERIQCPIRLYRSDYNRIKAKVVEDRITFQKLVEVLLLAYLKGNKEISRIVKKYADEKNAKKRRNYLNELEMNELYRIIEEEESPLRHLNQALKELEEEDGQDLHDRY